MIPKVKCECQQVQAEEREDYSIPLPQWPQYTRRWISEYFWSTITFPWTMFWLWLSTFNIFNLLLSNAILRKLTWRFVVSRMPLRVQGRILENFNSHPKQKIALAAISMALLTYTLYSVYKDTTEGQLS